MVHTKYPSSFRISLETEITANSRSEAEEILVDFVNDKLFPKGTFRNYKVADILEPRCEPIPGTTNLYKCRVVIPLYK